MKKKKKKKPLPLICLATKTLSVCEPSILIVVVVARAGLFTVRQIREWATYVFIYLFIFTLRYVIAPFSYLSRPLISAALAPALCQRLSSGFCLFNVMLVSKEAHRGSLVSVWLLFSTELSGDVFIFGFRVFQFWDQIFLSGIHVMTEWQQSELLLNAVQEHFRFVFKLCQLTVVYLKGP